MSAREPEEDAVPTDLPTAYVADKPRDVPSPEELRARIPGWGSDLAREDRPSVPRLRFDPDATGAHWSFPDRQPGGERRERSIEHAFLPPVFGTAQPLRGVAGVVRRFAYRHFSEGRNAHWLLLMAADRIDVASHRVTDAVAGHPDDLIGETGIGAERGTHPIASRVRSSRSDTSHTWMDPLVTSGPYVVAGGIVFLVLRSVVRGLRRR